MSYLHEHDILHGDLTSNNVLLATSDKDRRKFVAKVGMGLSLLPGTQGRGGDDVCC